MRSRYFACFEELTLILQAPHVEALVFRLKQAPEQHDGALAGHFDQVFRINSII